MGDKPPKPPPDKKNDVLAALESALLEARQRVSEAVEGLRAVMRGRESGKLADFAILDRDFMSVPVDQIGATTSLLTVVGGKAGYATDVFSNAK